MQVHDIFEADVINFHKARDRLRPVPTTQGHVSFVSLRKGDPEWERAWQWLRKIEESTYRYDFDNIKGEQWQYMGTEYVTAAEAEHQKKDMILHVRDGITGEGYYHNFRTRWHPTMEQRVYRLIPARRGWKPAYENVMAGKAWMDSIGAAVQQMAKDHPDLVEKPPIGEAIQHNVTQTPGFRAWFAGSKAVDRHGQPLKLYHGTPHGGFACFSSKKWRGIAGYFHTDPEFASICADPHFYHHKDDPHKGGPSIYPVYLSLKNPINLRHIEGDQDLSAEEFLKLARLDPKHANAIRGMVDQPVWSYLATPRVIELLKENGFDGVMYTEQGDAFIAFYPEQVKSAFNRGSFDSTNPNISETALHETEMPDRVWRLLGKPIKITLKDGRTGILKVERNKRDGLTVNVHVDGKYAGGLSIDPNDVPEPDDVDLYAEDRGSWSVSDVFVNDAYQRQGIATAMYNVLARAGLKIMRSGVYGGSLKPDGQSLWHSQAQWKRGREVHRRFWKPTKK